MRLAVAVRGNIQELPVHLLVRLRRAVLAELFQGAPGLVAALFVALAQLDLDGQLVKLLGDSTLAGDLVRQFREVQGRLEISGEDFREFPLPRLGKVLGAYRSSWIFRYAKQGGH